MVKSLLKYTVIKNSTQYDRYCQLLEDLVCIKKPSRAQQDEIDLLTALIEKYDTEHSALHDTDPIELLRFLMAEHRLKGTDLAKLLGVSKGLVSDILNYKKGLSKETIRILSARFKLKQEAFNRSYPLQIKATRAKNRRVPQKTTSRLG